ncbi:MAG: glycosyltransferase family 4 protein [Polyangiales bacterium]
MKIGLVSTCAVATPPKAYGGTELVVAELAHGLSELGHDVLVYATGDSRPHGTLRWIVPEPVFPPDQGIAGVHARFAFDDLARRDVDVIHFHDESGLQCLDRARAPCALTIHHERDEALVEAYRRHPSVSYVAISHHQAALSPDVPMGRVIHHGLDPDKYRFGRGEGGYAAFLGRFAPEKGTHHGIDAAVKAGVPVRLGGTAHPVARAYFDREVWPRLERHRDTVTWLGELHHAAKVEMLRGATALLMPIEWDEPFGLVMIEAMLVGTPVIAFPRGSTLELIEEGVTGFIVDDVEQMAARLDDVHRIDRDRCRQRAVERFSYLRMAREYIELYASTIAQERRRSRSSVVDAEVKHV